MWVLGCADDIERRPDLQQQRLDDIATIEEYISANGLGAYDTTESGARYIIMEVGDGDSIPYNRIVAVDFIGSTIEGKVFDTTIPEVADTAFSEVNESLLKPQVFTHTQSGWALNFITRLGSQFIADGQIPGRALIEAISIGLSRMRTGGKLLIFLPSDQAFEQGAASVFDPFTLFIDANTVVIYEIYPKEVF